MDLYQSYLSTEQKRFLSTLAIPFDANKNISAHQREYDLFKEIYRQRAGNTSPWGLVSWKFEHKSLISINEFLEFAANKFEAGYDCVFINPMIGNEALYLNVWEQGADTGHKGLKEIAQFLGENISQKIFFPMDSTKFAFCNYFLGTTKFWDAYFKFIDDALELLEAQEEIKSDIGLIFKNSASYAKDTTVTMKPFIIERLFSSFLSVSDMKTVNLPLPQNIYLKKFGVQMGEFLFKLSSLKNLALGNSSLDLLEKYQSIRSNILNSQHKISLWQLDDPCDYFLTAEHLAFMSDSI
jgi:hypothetical protein